MRRINPWGKLSKVGGARQTKLGQLAPLASTSPEMPALTPPEQFFGLNEPAAGGALAPPAPQGGYMTGARAGPTQFTGQVAGQAPAGLQRFTPMGGAAGGGADQPALIDPAQYADLLRRSPQAMAKLSPAVAATIQAYSADEATKAEQARAEQAITGISEPATTGPTAPPDIEGVMGDRRSGRYWSARERKEAGRISQQFEAQRRAIRESGRSAGPEYVRIALGQLDMQEQAALASSRATVQNRREDMEAEMDLQYANALLARRRTEAPLEARRGETRADILMNWPSQAEEWPGAESYMRGARMDELNAIMGGIDFNKGAGGSRVAGRTFGPVGGDTSGFGPFGGMTVTPHAGQFLGGAGGGGAGMPGGEDILAGTGLTRRDIREAGRETDRWWRQR